MAQHNWCATAEQAGYDHSIYRHPTSPPKGSCSTPTHQGSRMAVYPPWCGVSMVAILFLAVVNELMIVGVFSTGQYYYCYYYNYY